MDYVIQLAQASIRREVGKVARHRMDVERHFDREDTADGFQPLGSKLHKEMLAKEKVAAKQWANFLNSTVIPDLQNLEATAKATTDTEAGEDKKKDKAALNQTNEEAMSFALLNSPLKKLELKAA